MNFYQRANLSMCLAVFLGFEFAIVTSIISNKSIYDVNFYTISWLIFQFIFQLKLTIEDHNHFDEKRRLVGQRLIGDFFFFSVSNLLFVIAAATTFIRETSYIFFSAGLVTCSLWILYSHWMNKKFKTDSEAGSPKESNILWFVVNIIVICILYLDFHSDPSEKHTFIACQYQIILYVILFIDLFSSETSKNMPETKQ